MVHVGRRSRVKEAPPTTAEDGAALVREAHQRALALRSGHIEKDDLRPAKSLHSTLPGEALGAVHLAPPDWPPGSIIYRGAGEPNLRVIDTLDLGDPEKLTILVVEVLAASTG